MREWSYGGIEVLLDERAKRATLPEHLRPEEAAAVRAYHRSLPMYRATPLCSLSSLAEKLGVAAIYIKDESQRFGLNAFKALGASYAMARLLAQQLDIEEAELRFEVLNSPLYRSRIAAMTFATATDGNHGRGVAWAARMLGAQARVFMPKGSSAARVANIEREGAVVEVTEVNYDATVKIAQERAAQNGWFVVQDTAWPGYSQVPTWIAQGYLSMAEEAAEQLQAEGKQPSHLFLQAGVGTMAASVAAYHLARAEAEARKLHVGLIEPSQAACHLHSMRIGDGSAHAVGGDLHSIMAGLSCGVPNPDTFAILRDGCHSYFSCPDYVAARGMRLAAAPLGNDPRLLSGESAAVGLGLLSLICHPGGFAELREALGLDGSSVILLFSTEGNTDPAMYERVLYDGAYPTPPDILA